VAGASLLLVLLAFGGAQGAIHYVDDNATAGGDGTTWGTAFSTLQAALAAALPGDTVRVAQGTYAPDRGLTGMLGDPAATFTLPDGVIVEGGYVGLTGADPNVRNVDLYPTILDGQLQAIHVAPTGADTVDCGLFPSSPCATISYGVTRAASIGCKAILVRAGTYAEVIELTGTSGLLIQGGFDATWQFGQYDDPAHEVRIAGGLAASLNQYLAMDLDTTTNCTLADLVIEAPDAIGLLHRAELLRGPGPRLDRAPPRTRHHPRRRWRRRCHGGERDAGMERKRAERLQRRERPR
jgi:hypothetical protein